MNAELQVGTRFGKLPDLAVEDGVSDRHTYMDGVRRGAPDSRDLLGNSSSAEVKCPSATST